MISRFLRANSCNYVATARILLFFGAQRHISCTLDRLRAFVGACGDEVTVFARPRLKGGEKFSPPRLQEDGPRPLK